MLCIPIMHFMHVANLKKYLVKMVLSHRNGHKIIFSKNGIVII